MKILIYFPSNARAVDQQSVMEMLLSMGHEVFLLTWQEPGELHRYSAALGVKAYAAPFSSTHGTLKYFRHALFLRKFIVKHKIDFVFAHLEAPGVVAAVTRWMTPFKLIYFRHNTNAHLLDGNFNAKIGNLLCNMLAPSIVAVSRRVHEYLVNVEHVSPSKVTRINYAFNFSHYFLTDYTGKSSEIRQRYPADLLIVCVGRLVPLKRHLLMIEVVQRLKELQVGVKLICLGEGALRPVLESAISTAGLLEDVFLLGHQKNVLDYLEAADLLLHLSETESLGMVVLEAGLVKTPAMVCADVGIFDDFIDQENGYLVSKEDPVLDAVAQLSSTTRDELMEKGARLRLTVIQTFGIERVKENYEKLFYQ